MSDDNYEFLDTTHHEKLTNNLMILVDKWADKKLKAQQENSKAEAIIFSFFQEFAHDLLIATENMVEDSDDIRET